MARFGRLYKLIKLTKLFRIFKIMKEKSKILKYLAILHEGLERLFFFMLIFVILNHIVACLWIICGTMYGEADKNF